MRSFTRLRGTSQSHNLTSYPPPVSSTHYSLSLAALAARILYKSPLPSRADLPVYILDAAAFPDAKSIDYDALLPYVLARLPGQEELIGGEGYEIVFFAGGAGSPEGDNRGKKEAPGVGGSSVANSNEGGDGNKGSKKSRPGWGWFLQAYHVLTRAMRKRLMRLYVVHEKGWIRVVMEMFATIVSPKVRKKVVHVNTLTALALHIPIEDLLIPPSAYLTDRRKLPDIYAPYASGKRAFGVKHPFPTSTNGTPRLPRVLREATSFLLTDSLIETDGIFRISARAQTVEILREAYDRAQKFIVWKEGDATLTFAHYKEGAGTVTVDELDEIDGYDVHSAAAIIKLWYHELREPIFPQSSYQGLGKFYSDSTPPSADKLQLLLSPGTEYSPLPPTSSMILTTHLLPLLARIAEHSEGNRMTPVNLAVVFAPNLVCGPDPMEDFKISAIVQRLLVAMISRWRSDLAPALGLCDKSFEKMLQMPEAVADREDPLDEARKEKITSKSAVDASEQENGIVLLDNDVDIDDSSSDVDTVSDQGEKPALPPRPAREDSLANLPLRPRTDSLSNLPLRPRTDSLAAMGGFVSTSGSSSSLQRNLPPTPHDSQNQDHSSTEPTPTTSTTDAALPPTPNNVRRKPAPAVATLPRYSTIITNRPAVLAALQQYNANYNTGEIIEPAPAQEHGRALTEETEERLGVEPLPTYEQSTPVPERAQLGMPVGRSGAHGVVGGEGEEGEEEGERLPIPMPPPPTATEKVRRKPVGEGEGKGGG